MWHRDKGLPLAARPSRECLSGPAGRPTFAETGRMLANGHHSRGRQSAGIA